MQLPDTTHLELVFDPRGILHVTLAREETQNAFNQAMIDEVGGLMTRLLDETAVRAVVFRGKGGTFSAGGDLGELTAAMAQVNGGASDVEGQLFRLARGTGDLLEQIDLCPKIVISVLEGAALGTGLGIAAVSDVVLAEASAVLSLPEVMLGFSPSQISPFVARRIGLSATRMLAVTATRIDAAEAHRLGFADYLAADSAAVDATLARLLDAVLACEPLAVASTKALIRDLEPLQLGPYLDAAARVSVRDMASGAGRVGLNAFFNRTTPPWARRSGA